MAVNVNNEKRQSLKIVAEKAYQEIDVTNVPVQKIEITNPKHSQNIEIKNAPAQDINIEQDVIIVPVYEDAPLYEGDYEVVPKLTEQTLPTTKKFMEQDVKIKEIPITTVSNSSGGNTVIIGG